uniref:Sulfotransferase domain-containing protein n=1 Tax=Ditylum brightwellii TaxID=49249 RepID=A0A6S8S394_9STRA
MSTEDVENQSNDAGKTVEIEEKGAGDEGLPSSYTHKKNDMVLDADGSTMQEEGGGRILMQVPEESKKFFTKKHAIAAAVLVGCYGSLAGLIAIINSIFSSNRETTTGIKHTNSAFGYHDGDNFGYTEPSPSDITTATDGGVVTESVGTYGVHLNEPVVTGSLQIPPYLDAVFVDMFQQSEEGGPELTPYLGMATSGEYPVFWRVPTVGSRVESVLSGCVKAVLATSAFRDDERAAENILRVYNVENRAYVNVDLSQTAGIERASDLNLAETGIADLFVTPHLHYASHKLLSFPEHKGRMFTVFRHPIERAIARHSAFIKENQSGAPGTNPALAQMSLADFAQSEYSSKDWMTRFLVNKRTGTITPADVKVAKEILRKKCLIGLYDKIEESIERIERYFGWFKNNEIERVCHQNQIAAARAQDTEDYMYEVGREESIDVGSEVYELLVNNNVNDMEVYWYAVALFGEQGKLFPPPVW